MYVTVHGERVTVKCDDFGMFLDQSGKFHARTLKGLEKLMNIDPNLNPNSPPIRVEHIGTARQGRVTGKGAAKWSTSYRVKWDNGTSSVIGINSLRKPMTNEQRHQLETLSQTASNAEETYSAAQEIFEDFESQFDVQQDLRAKYGSAH